jgi:ABC-2 type transport system ATP-binding protein/lipopolysaccharide transport system ATP-binding protein
VVTLDRVSVCYRLPQEPIGSFKEYAIRRLQGRVRHRELWGLREISLKVLPGEILGVIGRNGAGKTTLLKVIARVLRPTSGGVRVVGHVAPLIDLGPGFHPELTGRENVFMNGALLGRTARAVQDRLNEILEFSELGEFIDAPLRTYSSGMVARLGFAVATAWQPDILLLDEVLAVGDEAFQQKCRLRLEGFRAKGSTVLLVSHNGAIIKKMCQKALWLDRGFVKAIGKADSVTDQYCAAAGVSLDPGG